MNQKEADDILHDWLEGGRPSDEAAPAVQWYLDNKKTWALALDDRLIELAGSLLKAGKVQPNGIKIKDHSE